MNVVFKGKVLNFTGVGGRWGGGGGFLTKGQAMP